MLFRVMKPFLGQRKAASSVGTLGQASITYQYRIAGDLKNK